MISSHNYILIMAGGTGTRLYPRSRENMPKQFQKIIGDKSLIEQTFDRVIQVVPNENIYISSNHKYVNLIKKYLPSIPEENIICEPLKKNTAPAMALATAVINRKDPEAIIATTASDHIVLKVKEFVKALKAGFECIKKNQNYILCIGISPTFAHTGLGYIERKESKENIDSFDIFNVKRFVEKPDINTAKEYLESGKFYWNAAYFIWTGHHLLSEIDNLMPKLSHGIKTIINRYDKNDYQNILKIEFSKFDDTPIDTGIMEKTERLLVLPADISWSDIGSFDVVASMLSQNKDKDGNYIEGLVEVHDTHNSLILNESREKLIATVGMDNIIIISSPDAIVVMPKGRSEEVKNIVEKLRLKKQEKLI